MSVGDLEPKATAARVKLPRVLGPAEAGAHPGTARESAAGGVGKRVIYTAAMPSQSGVARDLGWFADPGADLYRRRLRDLLRLLRAHLSLLS